MSEGPDTPYKVIHSGVIRDQLQRWAELAARAGVHAEYLGALRVIQENLERDPIGWGDPLYRARHLDLLICRRIYWFLRVTYGVHEEKRVGFIPAYWRMS